MVSVREGGSGMKWDEVGGIKKLKEKENEGTFSLFILSGSTKSD